MIDEFRELQQTVTLHRLAGYISTGGHHSEVFHGEEPLQVLIRPWQSDMAQQEPSGYTGETPGVKAYTYPGSNLGRGDRIVWKGEHFRLMNPQNDPVHGAQRWDLQTDERQLRLAAEMDEDVNIEPPDRDL